MAEKRQKRFPNLRAGASTSKKEPAGSRPGGRARSNANLRRGGPGRKPGVPNKVTREVKDLARRIIEDAHVQARMVLDARRGRLAPPVMTMLFHYAYGKPKENVEVKVLEQLRITITDDIGDEPTTGPEPAGDSSEEATA